MEKIMKGLVEYEIYFKHVFLLNKIKFKRFNLYFYNY